MCYEARDDDHDVDHRLGRGDYSEGTHHTHHGDAQVDHAHQSHAHQGDDDNAHVVGTPHRLYDGSDYGQG